MWAQLASAMFAVTTARETGAAASRLGQPDTGHVDMASFSDVITTEDA